MESLVTLVEENDLDGSSKRYIPHVDAFANVGGGSIGVAAASRRQRCSFVVLGASVVLVGGWIAHSLAGDVPALRQQGRRWIRERGVVHVQNSRPDLVSCETDRSKCEPSLTKKKNWKPHFCFLEVEIPSFLILRTPCKRIFKRKIVKGFSYMVSLWQKSEFESLCN